MVAYREPKPVISVGKVLEGHSIPVTLTDNNEDVQGSAVEVQWSEDGEEWTEGVKYMITSSEVPKYIFCKSTVYRNRRNGREIGMERNSCSCHCH